VFTLKSKLENNVQNGFEQEYTSIFVQQNRDNIFDTL